MPVTLINCIDLPWLALGIFFLINGIWARLDILAAFQWHLECGHWLALEFYTIFSGIILGSYMLKMSEGVDWSLNLVFNLADLNKPQDALSLSYFALAKICSFKYRLLKTM